MDVPELGRILLKVIYGLYFKRSFTIRQTYTVPKLLIQRVAENLARDKHTVLTASHPSSEVCNTPECIAFTPNCLMLPLHEASIFWLIPLQRSWSNETRGGGKAKIDEDQRLPVALLCSRRSTNRVEEN